MSKLRPIPGLGPGFYESGPPLPEDQKWNGYAFGHMTALEIVAAWTLIAMIVSEEGAAVTIIAPNADFGGPGYAVEACGSWTGYQTTRYTGDTILAALDAANRARQI